MARAGLEERHDQSDAGKASDHRYSEEELIRRRRVAQGNTHVPRLVEPGGRAPVDAL